MTYYWDVFDFKPLEDPREGIGSRVCGPFNPHGLVEGGKVGNVGQFPGKTAKFSGLVEILLDLFFKILNIFHFILTNINFI